MKLLDDFLKTADRLQSLELKDMRFSMFLDKVQEDKMKLCMKRRKLSNSTKFQEEYFQQLLNEDYDR